MRYLLDTTVLIDQARGSAGAPELIASLFGDPNDLLTCDIVVAEALSGGTDREIEIMRALVRSIEYVATHPDAAAWAGESRRRLGRTGLRGLGDAIIAGVAWHADAVIVTRNARDFETLGVRVLAYG
jgi:predicted nucleic acid-binding protein